MTHFIDWHLLEIADYQHYVKADAAVYSVAPVEDTVSRINGEQDGLSFCGPRIYRLIDAESVSSFLTIDSDAGTIKVEPKTDAEEGVHHVDVEVSLQNYPDIKEVATVTI